MRVLVADDSAAVRNALRIMLEQKGYEVLALEDGAQAFKALTAGEARLAILDWMMPGMDGVEICQRLAENHHTLTYVILLTSKSGNENIVSALQAGASDYLTKPFQPAELFARLRVGERITKLQAQLSQREKLEAIGRLASGIAHEINTPTQFVGDNTRFIRDAFHELARLQEKYAALHQACRKGGVQPGALDEIDALAKEIDLEYLTKEVPLAITQTLEGVDRVARIVRAMKEFSHPGSDEQISPVEINKSIENAIAVSRSEWKTVADVETKLDPTLPVVRGFPGQFNQTILNLIVNAAQALGEVVQQRGQKGKISISTAHEEGFVEVHIADDGPGIPEAIRPMIFEPFFTTKPVGKGTGQGLAIAHSAIVDKHGGTLTCETELGKGTTFTIRLPVESAPQMTGVGS
jgi:signal transduction histidine kinase